jgi:hypothetical protein
MRFPDRTVQFPVTISREFAEKPQQYQDVFALCAFTDGQISVKFPVSSLFIKGIYPSGDEFAADSNIRQGVLSVANLRPAAPHDPRNVFSIDTLERAELKPGEIRNSGQLLGICGRRSL